MESWEPSSDRIQKRYLPSVGMSMKPENRTPQLLLGWGRLRSRAAETPVDFGVMASNWLTEPASPSKNS